MTITNNQELAETMEYLYDLANEKASEIQLPAVQEDRFMTDDEQEQYGKWITRRNHAKQMFNQASPFATIL